MIAKIALPIILAILLANIYFTCTAWRNYRWWKLLLMWLLPVAVIIMTVHMAFIPNYFPDSIRELTVYLSVLSIYVVPMTLVALCSFVGGQLRHRKAGWLTGWLLGLAAVLTYLYGSSIGFRKLEVRHVEFSSSDLPQAFDGYRIVQFSDAHVGTYVDGRADILQHAVDSINAQKADLVVFTGDLQNMRHEEIEQHQAVLSSIKARDGVISVLGNHDYAEYINCCDEEKAQNTHLTCVAEQTLGWTLLVNDHRSLHRGNDSIVIAGMENDGEGRFPQRGDIQRTLAGVQRSAFVVMLEHDPTSWHRKILPHSHAQLTLSGHTHGGQFSLLGWSPVALRYREYNGFYHEGTRALYVSKGLGGVVPFRLGASGEIVVITLRTASGAKNDK